MYRQHILEYGITLCTVFHCVLFSEYFQYNVVFSDVPFSTIFRICSGTESRHYFVVASVVRTLLFNAQ